MIRVAAFLVIAAVAALGAAWFADRPGEVVLTWQHWQVTTSIGFAVVLFIVAVSVALFLWTAVRFALRSPDLVSLFFRERRRTKGFRAITQGLIAIGSGNHALALRSAKDARKFADENPLTLLLAAQTAQLSGDAEKAEMEFRAMLEHEDTRLLGLRGLYIEAERRNDAISARAYAQEAAYSEAMPAWAAEALIEFQTRAGDWNGALATLDAAMNARVIEKAVAKRRQAVLLTAQAQTLEESDPTRARELAQEAASLAPDLVPAAALAARLLGIEGDLRRGGKIIEKAWSIQPHPDLALAYAHLKPGDSAEDRLKRAKRLAKKRPGEMEAKLSVAQAAIEAHRFPEARALLEPLLADPTQRICLLMAELETAEHGDHGKAREWTIRALRARRDPAWIANGYVSREWLPASPQSGELDVFVWDVPDAPDESTLIEQAAESALNIPVSAPPRDAMRAEIGATRLRETMPPRVAPVIAEPPRPDDPGPQADEETPERLGF